MTYVCSGFCYLTTIVSCFMDAIGLLSLSMIAAIGRHAALAGLHPFQTVFLRLLIALLILLPFVFHTGLGKFKTSVFKLHLFRAANGICAMWLWFCAVAYIPIDEQTALSFLAPIFTTIGAFVFLGEIVQIRRITAIIVSICGAHNSSAWIFWSSVSGIIFQLHPLWVWVFRCF